MAGLKASRCPTVLEMPDSLQPRASLEARVTALEAEVSRLRAELAVLAEPRPEVRTRRKLGRQRESDQVGRAADDHAGERHLKPG